MWSLDFFWGGDLFPFCQRSPVFLLSSFLYLGSTLTVSVLVTTFGFPPLEDSRASNVLFPLCVYLADFFFFPFTFFLGPPECLGSFLCGRFSGDGFLFCSRDVYSNAVTLAFEFDVSIDDVGDAFFPVARFCPFLPVCFRTVPFWTLGHFSV